MRLRDYWSYGLLLLAVATVLICNRPDDLDLPVGVAESAVRLEVVEELVVERGPRMPGFRAARAIPAADAAVRLGGSFDGLQLEDVVVELGDGVRAHARNGRLGSGGLDLRTVEIFDDEGERAALTTADATIQGDRIRMPHLVVLDPTGATPRNRRDLRLSFAELRALLR